MPRQHQAFIEDILESVDRIEEFTAGMDFEEFLDNQKTFDAVLFNLENIGEAVRHLPDDFKQDSDIEWNDIAGFRDMIVHQYFNADPEIVWDIVQNELPELKDEVKDIRS